MINRCALLGVVWMAAVSLCHSQRTIVYTEINADFKKGLEFFDLRAFPMAQAEFRKVLERLQPVNEPEYRIIKTKAELYNARCAVRLEQPEAQKLMLDFARRHYPDPAANKALLELADYYYNSRKYDEAIQFYTRMDQRGFTQEEKDQITFRHGYCLYMRKRYDEAAAKFGAVMQNEGPYYFDGHYYYGMSNYLGGDYDEAISAWEVAGKTAKYRNEIPYYLTQIYASKQHYEKVIAYAEPMLNQVRLKNDAEMHQLVGQAYFELGDYAGALPHLEYYEQHSRKLREEDFYQLGFVQYQSGKYEDALESFKNLDKADSELGQSAMYYLADCYIRQGDLPSARNAFQKVARLDYDAELQEDALFQFAKLSVELHYDRDAVNTLQRFLPSSKYYSEAQELLSETLVNTKDYKGAIRIIESLEDQSPRIKEAYQKVTYYQGVQDYVSKDHIGALRYFQKSLSVPIDKRITALSTFWTGEIHYYDRKYAVSIADFNKFITMASTLEGLPPGSSLASAHYTQGYNYLKREDYNNALRHFESSLRESERYAYEEMIAGQLVPDAYLRAGDCNFKRNRYNLALNHYNKAISLGAPGYEYALFQKAIIQGLERRTNEKILALNQLVDYHSDSPYADDALLELGVTYQAMDRHNEAIRALDQLVSQYKGTSNLINAAYLRLGLVYYNQGDVESALENYKTIFENNPSSREAKDALAAIEEIYIEDLGRPDDYLAFKESIPGYEVSSSEKDSLNFVSAQRLYENAEYERAIVAFTEYLEKFPKGFNVLEALYSRGESYGILKRFDEALEDYESTLSRGQSAYYLSSLEKAALISYNHAEAFDKSYDYFSKLEHLTSDPQVKFEAQMGAMRSAYRTGRKEQASIYANKVVNNPLAGVEDHAIASFYRGKIMYENQEYAEAMRLFTGVVENSDNENTAEARYLIADIHFKQGDLETAEEASRSAYSQSGAYPFWVAKSLILLSDILVAKDDLFNARAALEAVIDNFKEDDNIITEAEERLAQIEAKENRRNRIQGND